MKFLKNIFKGILIGSGFIIPGVSSGVICVLLGLYEEILNKIFNFFKEPLKTIKFFFPYAIGGVIGIILVGKLILFLFNIYNTATCLAFAGLILGSIPSILQQGKIIKHNKIIHYITLLLTFSISLYLFAIEYSFETENISPSFFNLVIGGFLMSLGVVIPGISKSVILMIIGIYNTYLTAITTFDMNILIPLGIGSLLGSVLFLKIINYLLEHYKSYTYYAIAGFSIGSVLVIMPQAIFFNAETIIGIVLFIICLISTYKLTKIERKNLERE